MFCNISIAFSSAFPTESLCSSYGKMSLLLRKHVGHLARIGIETVVHVLLELLQGSCFTLVAKQDAVAKLCLGI